MTSADFLTMPILIRYKDSQCALDLFREVN